MKLKLLARGKAETSPAAGTDEEQHNNKKSKEKKSSSKTKSLKESGSTTKTTKEKKSKKEEKKDGKAGGSTEGESSEPINTKLTGSSRKLRPLSKNQPHDEPSSPRGAAVSKWEQALKEELSRSPPDTPPSNHQRFATAGGAPPAVPSGPPTETEIEAEERRKRRQQRALESYQNRPRIPTTRRAYEAGVGVGPAEAINRHLRGGGEEGPWLLGAQLAIVPRGEAEGLEVEAGDDWYEQLRSDDEEDIDPEQLLLELAAQQQERELLEQSGLSPRQVLQEDAEPQEEKEEGD